MAIKPETSAARDASLTAEERAKREAEVARRFVDELNASPIGMTPNWQRAIDTYKRVKAQKVTR